MTRNLAGALALALLIGAPALAWADGAPHFILEWGAQGEGPGQFVYPDDVAVDAAGNVYVSDQAHRIQKFDNDGNFLLQWDVQYSGDLAVHGDFVYAVSGNRVKKYDQEGTLLATSQGFYGLKAIAVSPDGEVTVSENGCYDGSLTFYLNPELEVLKRVDAGCGNRAVAVNARGESCFVQNGGYLKCADDLGIARMSGIYDIFFSAQGYLYFTTRTQIGVVIDGQPLRWGAEGTGPGQFDFASGIAVDSQGHVFVADTRNHRVQKLALDAILPARWGWIKERYLDDAQTGK